MKEIVGQARLNATNGLIAQNITPASFVVEIGASDASFAAFHGADKWLTVDKYGSPDVKADLDGECAKLPFADGTVDMVICTEVLEHLVMGTPLVREIGRVLKKGGVAIVSVPNICSLKSRLKVLFGGLPNLAASGDCGHPLGGTGILINDNWVAAHVVDFNFQRLSGYLARGGLRISRAESLPLQVKVRGRSRTLVPAAMMSPVLSDFLIVVAQKEAKRGDAS